MVMAPTACYLTRVYDFLNVKEKLHENKKWLHEITEERISFTTCNSEFDQVNKLKAVLIWLPRNLFQT